MLSRYIYRRVQDQSVITGFSITIFVLVWVFKLLMRSNMKGGISVAEICLHLWPLGPWMCDHS